MDKLNMQKPSKKQIKELGEVIRKINEENNSQGKVIPAKKIAISEERLLMEYDGHQQNRV